MQKKVVYLRYGNQFKAKFNVLLTVHHALILGK